MTPIPSTRRGKLPTQHYVPKKKQQRKRSRKWLRIVLICVTILIATGVAVTVPYLTPGAQKDHMLYIPQNATRNTLKDSLTRHFGESFAQKVTTIVPVNSDGKLIRSGAFFITKGMSPLRVAHKITRGAQTPTRITINGFRNIDDMIKRIATKTNISSQEFKNALYDKAFLEQHGLTRENCIALFIENTYEFYWTDSPQKIVNKIGQEYDRIWNKSRREKAEELGLTPTEVMTLCSIVDEETNAIEEKGTIGRLYINRYQKGMKLQADPTVRYALNDFSIRRVTGKHTQVKSPYNTYQVEGLPPGPIRTTSKETIDAVLDSKPNDYIYMCAKEDFSGTHNFAVDYAEHQENARKYQNALNERGIK